MIKHFCDICGKETSIQRDWNAVLPIIKESERVGCVYDSKPFLICEKCSERIALFVKEIERYSIYGN
jgi:hypothetical protein